MPALLNPYAANNTTTNVSPTRSTHLPLTIAGVAFGIAAMLGAIIRIANVMLNLQHWRTLENRIADSAPLMGLSVFAATASVLLIMLASQPIKQAEEVLVSQAFITVATLAMLVRVLWEPDCAWAPHGSVYLLTSSAGVAMGMVLLRLRKT